jgi:protoheme IX farnesyltransferase
MSASLDSARSALPILALPPSAPGLAGEMPAPLPPERGPRAWLAFVHDLLVLTKYRITLVALFTGYAAIAVQGRYATDIGHILPCLVALFAVGGCANTLNQLFERHSDGLMSRTRARRPLPSGRISPRTAIIFASLQAVLALAILLGVYGSPLAAGMALLTIVYYAGFYTLYLKRRHYLNIVVGGLPGAMGPVIAWAAMDHRLTAVPLALCAVIFLWTPPHVWALAIRLKDDYARAGIPMLPVVKGIDETTRQIFIYTVVMVAGTLAVPWIVDRAGPTATTSPAYTVLAVALGAVFLVWSALLWRRRPVMATMPLFRFSIIYIAALFAGLIIDAFARRPGTLP